MAETIFGALRLDERGLCGGDVRFRRTQLVLIVLHVKRRQRVALLDRGAHIDPARDQLAGDAERQIALVARLHLAYRLAVVEDGFGIDDNGTHRPDLQGRVLRLAPGKNQQKGEKNAPRPHDDAPATNALMLTLPT